MSLFCLKKTFHLMTACCQRFFLLTLVINLANGVQCQALLRHCCRKRTATTQIFIKVDLYRNRRVIKTHLKTVLNVVIVSIFVVVVAVILVAVVVVVITVIVIVNHRTDENLKSCFLVFKSCLVLTSKLKKRLFCCRVGFEPGLAWAFRSRAKKFWGQQFVSNCSTFIVANF